MLRTITVLQLFLYLVVISSVILCKYFHKPSLFLLVIIIAGIFYQKDANNKYISKYNFEDTVINLSKFIIIAGMSGYIFLRIIGFFTTGVD